MGNGSVLCENNDTKNGIECYTDKTVENIDRCDLYFESDIDLQSEEIKKNNFKPNGCGCTRLYLGKPCIVSDKLISYRQSCLKRAQEKVRFNY